MWEAIGRQQSAAPAPRPIRVQDNDRFFESARFTSPSRKLRGQPPPRGGKRTV